MEALNKLLAHVRERPAEIIQAKRRDAKIVGYTPGGYFPEELAHACGVIPTALLRGGDHEALPGREGRSPNGRLVLAEACRRSVLEAAPEHHLTVVEAGEEACTIGCEAERSHRFAGGAREFEGRLA